VSRGHPWYKRSAAESRSTLDYRQGLSATQRSAERRNIAVTSDHHQSLDKTTATRTSAMGDTAGRHTAPVFAKFGVNLATCGVVIRPETIAAFSRH